MTYYSQVKVIPLDSLLDYQQSIVTLGSCFSDQIGRLLQDHRFDTTVNPLGILYNPHTISRHLATAITHQSLSPDGYLTVDGLTYHHDFHSTMKAESISTLESKINAAYLSLGSTLKTANLLIITLGTAVAYRHINSGHIVGNCHRVAQSQFDQILLSSRAITTRLSTVITALREYNPSLQILLTVSPVRYLKYGAILNNRSKAQLLIAAMRLEERHESVTYWPAYELFMDELRDYRWVESDLVHPNKQAVEVIWSRFVDSALDRQSQLILRDVKSINAQLSHRPFNPQSASHLAAQHKLYQRMADLRKTHPYLQWSEEERHRTDEYMDRL